VKAATDPVLSRSVSHDPVRDPAIRAEAANLLEVHVVQHFKEPGLLVLSDLRQEIRHSDCSDCPPDIARCVKWLQSTENSAAKIDLKSWDLKGRVGSTPNNGHLWRFNAAGKVVKFDHVTDTCSGLLLPEQNSSADDE